MRKKAALVILPLSFAVLCLSGQTGSHPLIWGKGHLTLQYFRVDRKQLGDGTAVFLKNDFSYLRPFDNSQGFAPDEPSTFSSLEYTFLARELGKKWRYELSAGIFRNHIKGDFLLDPDKVHFGRGNSQIGVSATWLLVRPLFFYEKMSLGFSVQAGAGPHFTRLTAGNSEVTPGTWGIRGWGVAGNAGLWLNSPVFLKRWMLSAGGVYHLDRSSYGSFRVEYPVTGERVQYDDIWFASASRQPRFTVLLKCDIKKKQP